MGALRIGEFQRLAVRRETVHGWYLGYEGEEVLLPRGESDGLAPGDELEVFLLTDSEDRPVATLRKPHAAVGEFAVLKCVGATDSGAFLDWGLLKDLFCPLSEQKLRMRKGESYLVHVYLDERSRRPVCSSKLSRFLQEEAFHLRQGQQVDIVLAERLPQFWIAIVEGRYKGMIFTDEMHDRMQVGDRRMAYVKQVREDGRLALSLRPQGYRSLLAESDRVLEALRAAGGSLPVSDKSSPEEIHRLFGLSKGSFKKLIGTLYREGVIDLTEGSIKLR
jgi:uncharacterized protein